jgi:hypothetical protein
LSREERITKNEALFREVNERIEELQPDQLPSFEVVCECGDRECHQTLEVGTDDYARVRSHPTHFFVTPGHEIPDVETVIETTARFNVVEKHVDEEQIARLTDRLPPPER